MGWQTCKQFLLLLLPLFLLLILLLLLSNCYSISWFTCREEEVEGVLDNERSWNERWVLTRADPS